MVRHEQIVLKRLPAARTTGYGGPHRMDTDSALRPAPNSVEFEKFLKPIDTGGVVTTGA